MAGKAASNTSPLWERVEAINDWLKTTEDLVDADGKHLSYSSTKGAGGNIYVGYDVQWVCNGVNAILGVENWRYETSILDAGSGPVTAKVTLFLRDGNGEWIQKGDSYGASSAPDASGPRADLYKAAIADGLKKVFSVAAGIGMRPYTGMLAAPKVGNAVQSRADRVNTPPPAPPVQQEQPVVPPPPPAPVQVPREVNDDEYKAILEAMATVLMPDSTPYFTRDAADIKARITGLLQEAGFDPAKMDSNKPALRQLPATSVPDVQAACQRINARLNKPDKALEAPPPPPPPTPAAGNPLAAPGAKPWDN